jgi:YD repeat-containing protein
MRFFAAIALIICGWSATAEAAGTPTHRYALTLSNQPIGERAVTIRQLETPTGTLQLLQAWTFFTFDTPVGKFQYRQRLAARLGEGSFTSSIDDGGSIREVQAHRNPEGAWQVTVIADGKIKTWALPAKAIDLVSPDFLDGQRTLWTLEALAASAEEGQHASLKVLAAETGAILDGPLIDLGIDEIEIGTRTVAAHGFTWSPEGQKTTLWYTAEGLLLGWTTELGGRRLEALIDAESLQATLAPRIEDVGGGVEEEAL